jgi:dolichyl-phosphate-mannose--protein O-mannosyl transferase
MQNKILRFIAFLVFIAIYIFSIWALMDIASTIFAIRKFSVLEISLILLIYNVASLRIFSIHSILSEDIQEKNKKSQ